MRGQKTDPRIVDQINLLRKMHRANEIVRVMEGQVSRRTVYRILWRLRERDAKHIRESEKAIVEDRREEIRERLAARLSPKIFKRSSQFPPNLRKVSSA
jgi:hypothetical protein